MACSSSYRARQVVNIRRVISHRREYFFPMTGPMKFFDSLYIPLRTEPPPPNSGQNLDGRECPPLTGFTV